MMQRVKRAAPGLVLWGLFVLLMALALQTAVRLGGVYGAISLRYHTPVGYDKAAQARRYAAQSGEGGFALTFYAEDKPEFAGGLHKATARCLWFSGDGYQVWPANFMAGAMPAALDGEGCALSSGLCWQLWGSYDAMGNTVEIGGRTYTVRGVFNEAEPLAMASVGEGMYHPGWQAVQLQGIPLAGAEEAARAFATASGLGQPDTLVNGPALKALCTLLAGLPLCALLLYTGARLLYWAMQKAGGKREFMLFLLLLGLALALPALLALLPASLVPSRWSDFSFWGRLGQRFLTAARAYFSLRPLWPDTEASLLMAKQAALCFGGFAALLGLGWRYARLGAGESVNLPMVRAANL